MSHTFIRREVDALRDMGFDVRTFSVRRTGPEDLVGPELRDAAAQTYFVLEAAQRPWLALRAHASAVRRDWRTWLKTFAAAWRTAPPGARGKLYNVIYFHEAVVLALELRRQGVVHLHNHFAMSSCTVARLAADLAGITWSFTLHGPDDLADPFRWRLDDKVAQADFVVCISAFARSQVMLHSARDHWDKLHIVHCGIEPGLYDRSNVGGTNDLLFVGRLAAQKGVPVLLAAFDLARRVRPALKLTLIGDGPDRAALEGEVRSKRLDDAVTFLGYRSQEEVAQILSRSSALVLPSFAEGVPVVLMEAMASGLPVIATRVGGVTELVDDGVTGRLVAPGEEQMLADAILDLIVSNEALAHIGSAGRERVRSEFNIRREAARLASIILWARSGGARPARRPAEAEL